MKVTIDDKAGTITIVLPLAKPYKLSKGGLGNNLIVATTSGNAKTGVQVEGRELTIGVNAYIPKA